MLVGEYSINGRSYIRDRRNYSFPCLLWHLQTMLGDLTSRGVFDRRKQLREQVLFHLFRMASRAY